MSRFSRTDTINKTKVMAGDSHSKILILAINKDIPYTEFKDPAELIEANLVTIGDDAYKVAVAIHSQSPTVPIKAIYGENKSTSTNTSAEAILLNLYEQGHDNFAVVTNAFFEVTDIESLCNVVAIKDITAVLQLKRDTTIAAAETMYNNINLKKVCLVMTDQEDMLAGRICGAIYPFFPGSQNTTGAVLQGAKLVGYTTTELNKLSSLGIVTYPVGSRSGGIDYGACTQAKGTDGTWFDIAIGENWLKKENNRRTNNAIMSSNSIAYAEDGMAIFSGVINELVTEGVEGGFFLGNKDGTAKDFVMNIKEMDEISKDELGQRIYNQEAEIRVANKIHEVVTTITLTN